MKYFYKSLKMQPLFSTKYFLLANTLKFTILLSLYQSATYAKQRSYMYRFVWSKHSF